MDELNIRKNLRFFIVYFIFLFINLLIVYFYSFNIYTQKFYIDLLFVLIILSFFKFLGFSSFHFLLYIFSLLVIGLLFIIFRRVIFSNKLSYFLLYSFVLLFLLYIYEEKIEIKIPDKRRKKVYLNLVVVFSLIVIFVFGIVNFSETKLLVYSTFLKDKYFREITPTAREDGIYESDMLISVDIPKNYSTVSGVFHIGGWAIDRCKLEGSKIDGVFVYLYSSPLSGGKFIKRAIYGGRREDVAKIYGEKFVNCGYDAWVDMSSFDNGFYTFYICFHSRYFGVEYRKLELFVKN